jgi:hypothetical protein
MKEGEGENNAGLKEVMLRGKCLTKLMKITETKSI